MTPLTQLILYALVFAAVIWGLLLMWENDIDFPRKFMIGAFICWAIRYKTTEAGEYFKSTVTEIIETALEQHADTCRSIHGIPPPRGPSSPAPKESPKFSDPAEASEGGAVEDQHVDGPETPEEGVDRP